jgi:hypothetical protein
MAAADSKPMPGKRQEMVLSGGGGTGNVQEKIVLINNPRIERKDWSRSGTSSNTKRRHYSHILEKPT